MAAVARMLGVNPEDIVLESQSQDTGQQLMFILKKIVTLLLMPMSLCLGVSGEGVDAQGKQPGSVFSKGR
jgi:hypothetical protein